mgnify:FL=1
MALDCLANVLHQLLNFASVPAGLPRSIGRHINSIGEESPTSLLIVAGEFGDSKEVCFPEFSLRIDSEHFAARFPDNGAAPVVLDAVLTFAAA